LSEKVSRASALRGSSSRAPSLNAVTNPAILMRTVTVTFCTPVSTR
jgi:hypothetical protein